VGSREEEEEEEEEEHSLIRELRRNPPCSFD